MDAIVERCCGLDVHQASVMACVLVGEAGRKARREVRRFGTFLEDLEKLRDWLTEEGVTHVGMESTGVYWRPVYRVLEGHFDLLVGNAHHMKNVPGRKTDVKDSEWIADLVRHGLVAKSFVPPKPIQELRDLMRFRRKLVESRGTERNRVLKVLELTNVKLSTVATNVFGASGLKMLAALIQGDAAPAEMAGLAYGRMKRKRVQLTGALAGKLEDHHRFLLKLGLSRLKQLDKDVAKIDRQVEKRMKPYRAAQALLETIPGFGPATAGAVLSEIGPDVSAFRGAGHLAAWAGVCPGNNESAGRQLGGGARKGNRTLRTALVEATLGAVRKRDSYFRAKFHRLKVRRGGKRAMLAIAHKLLIATYHVLRDGKPFAELGGGYLDQIAAKKTRTQLVHRLERLGYDVQLTEKTPTPGDVPEKTSATHFS